MAIPIKKPVWTNLDAFGLLNGISTWDENYLNLKYVRVPNETNIELRRKIKNMHNNPVEGVSLQDVINGLSNELLLDQYNVRSNKTFDLTRTPYPSGSVGVQDIFVYYQPLDDTNWYSVGEQVWGSGYYSDEDNTIPVTSGFIVWEDGYYKDPIVRSEKGNVYSKILQIMTPLPDNSRIKSVYSTKLFDINGDADYFLYTDMDDSNNPDDESYMYRFPTVIDSGILESGPVAYNMSQLPDELSGYYFNTDGSGTDRLYKLRDIINKNFKHKWKDIRNRESIWDINKSYSKGVIPSYSDTAFVVNSGDTFSSNYFDGGIEHMDDALYIKDIHIQVSGNIENWYPIVQPGKFYYDGFPYYIMENPQYVHIDMSTGSGTLPSGILRNYKTILASSGDYTSDLEGFMFQDYMYPIRYKNSYETVATGVLETENIYRKRPYLNSDMGLDITLSSGEYYINTDTNPPIMYGSGLSDCVFVWDGTDVPSGRICDTEFSDLNPLNDYNVAYERYFLVIGD